MASSSQAGNVLRLLTSTDRTMCSISGVLPLWRPVIGTRLPPSRVATLHSQAFQSFTPRPSSYDRDGPGRTRSSLCRPNSRGYSVQGDHSLQGWTLDPLERLTPLKMCLDLLEHSA